MSTFVRAALAAICLTLSACGSVSRLEHSGGHDFRAYRTIVIGTLGNKPAIAIPDDKRLAYDTQVGIASSRFAKYLERELRAYRMDVDVVRGEPRPGALFVEGDITRYANGNAALRLFFGFGAGSSYFDAFVRFRDTDSGDVLVIEELAERAAVLDIYEVASGLVALGFANIRIAFVDRNVDELPMMQFGETVARNRGIDGRVFANEADADAWLRAEHDPLHADAQRQRGG